MTTGYSAKEHLAHSAGLVALTSLLLVGSGCRDNDTTVSGNTSSFTLHSDVDFFTGSDTHSWNTVLEEARVDLRIDNFHAGNCRVRIVDDRGRQIYDQLFWYYDNTWIVGGAGYHAVTFTDDARPGWWNIQIYYDQFTGDLDLLID